MLQVHGLQPAGTQGTSEGKAEGCEPVQGVGTAQSAPQLAFTLTGPGFLFPSPLLDLCPNFPSLVSPPCSDITSPYNGR